MVYHPPVSNHQQAAIGILNHVGWMKVDAARREKILIAHFVSSSLCGLKAVPTNLSQVELATEEIPIKVGT